MSNTNPTFADHAAKSVPDRSHKDFNPFVEGAALLREDAIPVHTMDERDPMLTVSSSNLLTEEDNNRFRETMVTCVEGSLEAFRDRGIDDDSETLTARDEGTKLDPSRRKVMSAFGVMAAAAGLGALSVPNGKPSYAFMPTAEAATVGKKDITVFLFNRGGWDFLSMVAPVGDTNYSNARPKTRIDAAGAVKTIQLDSQMYLNGNCAALMKPFKAGQAAFITGLGLGGRRQVGSHFIGADMYETAPAMNKTGVLGVDLATSLSTTTAPQELVVSWGDKVAKSAWGAPGGGLSVTNSFQYFDIYSPDASLKSAYRSTVEASYAGKTGILADIATAGLGSMDRIAKVRNTIPSNPNGASYTNSGVATSLKEIAQMIKANVGMQAATLDIGSWDMHANSGLPSDTNGWMNTMLRSFSQNVAAFWDDLGPELQKNVTVIAVSEFGRRVNENDSLGFDHGYGGGAVILSGGINGGKVYRDSAYSLAPSDLYGGNLEITMDYEQVIGDYFYQRRANRNIDQMFPGYPYVPNKTGIFKSIVT